jgi:hypothetical protein
VALIGYLHFRRLNLPALDHLALERCSDKILQRLRPLWHGVSTLEQLALEALVNHVLMVFQTSAKSTL